MSGEAVGRPIDVVFVAGFGRSGSTLLDRLLGQVPGITALGETRFLWERGFLDDDLCACGEPFSRCPFWSPVAADLPAHVRGALDPVAVEQASRRSLRPLGYVRWRSGLRGASARTSHALLADATLALLRAVTAHTGTTWLTDSSKSPSYAHLLNTLPGVRVHVVHLVRDARAVAFSWTRVKARGQRAGRATMIRYGPVTSSLRWMGNNLATEALRGRVSSYHRVRYEDFVRAPSDTVRGVLAAAGFPGPVEPAFISGRNATVATTHSVSGNPDRFTTGTVTVRTDDEWRSHLEGRGLRLVTLLCWPLLARYGYLAGPRGPAGAAGTS